MTSQVSSEPTDLIVAEDDPDAREALVEVLEFEGFRVIACADGPEALAAFAARPHSILVTDLVLSAMDGITLAREVVRRHPDCRVIIMSGYPPNSRDYPRDWEWLRKPLDIEALVEAIRHRAIH